MSGLLQWFSDPGRSNLANWLIALINFGLAIIAIAIGWNAQRRQNELQARLVEIEQVRERERQRLARKAILRAELIHERGSRSTTEKLRIYNDGDAEAREMVIQLDGEPVGKHPAVVDVGADVSRIGPRSYVQYMVALTHNTFPPWNLEIKWTDDSGEPGLYRTTITA